jgi:hypothetical protein
MACLACARRAGWLAAAHSTRARTRTRARVPTFATMRRPSLPVPPSTSTAFSRGSGGACSASPVASPAAAPAAPPGSGRPAIRRPPFAAAAAAAAARPTALAARAAVCVGVYDEGCTGHASSGVCVAPLRHGPPTRRDTPCRRAFAEKQQPTQDCGACVDLLLREAAEVEGCGARDGAAAAPPPAWRRRLGGDERFVAAAGRCRDRCTCVCGTQHAGKPSAVLVL